MMPVNCFTLFLLFMRFDLLCFGGGYVLIPLLIEEFVEKDGLITTEQFGNLFAIAQVTPGPVGLNSATYVGYITQGVPGAFCATLGLIVPTLIIGGAATYSIYRWKNFFLVRGILKGTRLAAVAMVLYAVTVIFGISVFHAPIPWSELAEVFLGKLPSIPQNFGISPGGALICIATCILVRRTKISSTLLILASAVLGAIFCVK